MGTHDQMMYHSCLSGIAILRSDLFSTFNTYSLGVKVPINLISNDAH
jgi:hypothetical protein